MSQQNLDDPRCPECGGAIGATATYCMHCQADLTEEKEQADTDGDGYWDDSPSSDSPIDAGLLDPDGVVDDTLTLFVGIGGGLVIGIIANAVLLLFWASSWMLLVSIPVWLLATRHLVSRDTVHEAIARAVYGVALVLVTIPFIAFSPSSGGTPLGVRFVVFLVIAGGFVIPAVLLAGVGYLIARNAPERE